MGCSALSFLRGGWISRGDVGKRDPRRMTAPFFATLEKGKYQEKPKREQTNTNARDNRNDPEQITPDHSGPDASAKAGT